MRPGLTFPSVGLEKYTRSIDACSPTARRTHERSSLSTDQTMSSRSGSSLGGGSGGGLSAGHHKLAEKLSLINDRGVGMLTRIYNIKKVCCCRLIYRYAHVLLFGFYNHHLVWKTCPSNQGGGCVVMIAVLVIPSSQGVLYFDYEKKSMHLCICPSIVYLVKINHRYITVLKNVLMHSIHN